MKKLSTALIILLALLTIVACNGDTKGPDQNNETDSIPSEYQSPEDANTKKTLIGYWSYTDEAGNEYYYDFSEKTVTYKISQKEPVTSKYNVLKNYLFLQRQNKNPNEHMEMTYDDKDINNKKLYISFGDENYELKSEQNEGIVGAWKYISGPDPFDITLNKDLTGMVFSYTGENSRIGSYKYISYSVDKSTRSITITPTEEYDSQSEGFKISIQEENGTQFFNNNNMKFIKKNKN